MLIEERGNIKAELKRGEHKSPRTDLVILMPGPEEEVAWVNKMCCWLVKEELFFREIADRLSHHRSLQVLAALHRAPGSDQ